MTTLDVVSAGRAILGIGAGWFEREHVDYGLEFGTFSDRFVRLEEALNIITPMLRGENPTYDGQWYHVQNALNEPRLRPSIPVLLGGSGEQKTFRLAALFADHMNIICDKQDIPRKVAALAQRCEEAGRDPKTIETSYLAFVFIADTAAEAEGFLRQLPPERRSRLVTGTAEQVAEQVKTEILDAGIGGLTLNMVVNGHVPGVITLAAQALRPLVAFSR